MATAATANAARDKNKTKDKDKEEKKHPRDPAREVVETVVFVVVLVLLLKLFVTEAFVIPTGSMAETLYGYQKIVTCGKCGHQFPVNAHDEVEVNANTKLKHPLVGYVCPNCRYVGEVQALSPRPDPRTGDRVLVLKPLYHIRPPRRGDVVVFKYPEEPQKDHIAANYIKRAMGFGGETVAIHRGKLYVTMSLAYPPEALDPDGRPLYPRPDNPLDLWQHKYMYANSAQAEQLFADSRAAGFTDKVPGGFRIVRKEEDQLLADRRVVWDNDKQPRDLAGVPPRWHGAGRWNPDNPLQPRAFAHSGDEQLDWVTYRHFAWRYGPQGLRTPWRWREKWQEGEQGLFMLATHMNLAPVTGPIDNMLGYNAGIEYNPLTKEAAVRDQGRDATMWVGDLILECEAEVAAGATVVLALSKGADRFLATFGNGQVELTRDGPRAAEFGKPTRACKVTAGTYQLRFANVDNRLWVWVNGKRIDFGAEGDYTPAEPAKYDDEDTMKEGWTKENDIDRPAQVGAKGAVNVRGLKLYRDVYYTRDRASDYTGADIYYVQPGHYLCLGDNSAQSSDSRKWGAVPERLMLGKAVFVFWPGYPSPSRIGFIK